MDYSQLSDFEINLKVAHIVLGKNNYDWDPERKKFTWLELMVVSFCLADISTHVIWPLTHIRSSLKTKLAPCG